MSPELEYLAYAMEKYRFAKGMAPADVAALFHKHGLSQVVLDNYYLYHTESPTHMLLDLDSYLENGHPLGNASP